MWLQFQEAGLIMVRRTGHVSMSRKLGDQSHFICSLKKREIKREEEEIRGRRREEESVSKM